MRAGISADGPRSDNRYLPTHAFLPTFLRGRLARRSGASQTVFSDFFSDISIADPR
jgi:hypothetical protein